MPSKKKKKKQKRYLSVSKPNFKNPLNSDKQIYILFKYFDHPRDFARNLEIYISLRKPTRFHVLHRNKTFNTGKYTRLFTASGASKLVKYIYISKKKTSNILLCLFPRTKFCNSDYSSCSFVCRLICVNRARSCTPSCKPRLGKARAIKKREGERERERDESRN